MQTLDLEFDEWCHELLRDGIDPIEFLRIQSQCRFIWDACRKRCAQLCVEHDCDEMAKYILKNEDGAFTEND